MPNIEEKDQGRHKGEVGGRTRPVAATGVQEGEPPTGRGQEGQGGVRQGGAAR